MNEYNRKGIEESAIFLALITESYLEDPYCLELIFYAKSLNKPLIALVEKKMLKNLIIPDILKDFTIIDVDSLDDINTNRERILKIIKEKLE